MVTSIGNDGTATGIGFSSVQEPAASEVATPRPAGRRGATDGVIAVGEQAAPPQGAVGLLGGDPTTDAEIVAEFISALGVDELYGADGKLDGEALFNFFLTLCDNLKRFALSGALDETEAGRALAERMDELKDRIIELQDEIQQSVFELEEAEADARRVGAGRLIGAWLGVVAACIATGFTAGGSAPLLAAAVAAACCAGVSATVQTVVFVDPECIDTSSESYERGMKALMGLELILGLGVSAAAGVASSSVKALVRMGSSTVKSMADDVGDDVLNAVVRKTLDKADDLAPPSSGAPATKSTVANLDEGVGVPNAAKDVADKADDAVRNAPGKPGDQAPDLASGSKTSVADNAAEELPPSGQKAQDGPAKPDDEVAAAKPDEVVDADDAFKKKQSEYDADAAGVEKKADDLYHNMQRLTALIDAIEVVGGVVGAAFSIKSRQRVTEAQIKSMSLREEADSTENALMHVEQSRTLADQRRNELRGVDANLLNAQLDLIQKDREIGLSIAEWRRF